MESNLKSDSNDNIKPKKNARDLLMAYYGNSIAIEQKDSPTFDTNSKSTESFNLDSQSFEPEKYLTKILHEQPISDLISTHSDLLANMKEIDSDKKTLVYENYNKFISAINTIKTIEQNVDSMEAEVQLLQNNVENISKTAKQVNQVLAEKRSHIQRLVSIRGPLNTMQSIMDLPNKMNVCINQKAYLAAQKLYQRSAAILAANRHLSLFNNIEKECEALLVKIAPFLSDEPVAAPQQTKLS